MGRYRTFQYWRYRIVEGSKKQWINNWNEKKFLESEKIRLHNLDEEISNKLSEEELESYLYAYILISPEKLRMMFKLWAKSNGIRYKHLLYLIQVYLPTLIFYEEEK